MPVFEITDNVTGVILEAEGDSEPTEQEKAQIFQNFYALNPQEAISAQIPEDTAQTIPQERREDLGFLGGVAGTAQLAGSLAGSIVAEPIAGLAGIAGGILPGEPGQAAETVEAVRGFVPTPGEAGLQVGQRIGEFAGDVAEFAGPIIGEAFTFAGDLFEQAKEAAFQKFGPIGGTVVATAPTAILEAVPALSVMKKAKNIPIKASDEIIDEIGDATRAQGVRSIKTGIPPEIKTQQQITADLKKTTKRATRRIAAEVRPDPEILASAQALGVDLNPSHYSTNRAFIEVERALASRPGSLLNTVEEKAITDVGNAADKLITDLRGTVDKSLLDFNVRKDIEDNRISLKNQSDKLYGKVNEAIPRVTRVNPEASRKFMEKKLADIGDIGGDKEKLLTTAEKTLLILTKDPNNVTYGALDIVRRDIGNALGKKLGPFEGDDKRVLAELYDVLSDDQQGVADILKVGPEYAAARKLVFDRKEIEKEAVKLFGKDVQGSILPALTKGATALTKGDVSQFKALMKFLPENRRQEVAASLLNEIFSAGTRKKGPIGSGIVNAFASLNRNKGAKDELFKHLPAGSRKRFDDIGRVATGIFKSQALENKSRTARDIQAALDDLGLFSKLYQAGKAGALPEAVGSVAGAPGLVTGTRIISGDVFKKKTTGTQVADELLTSPVFKKSIEDAASGKPGAGEGIQTTGVFKRWLTAQRPNVKAEIAAIGFIPFLTGEIDATMTFTEPQFENR